MKAKNVTIGIVMALVIVSMAVLFSPSAKKPDPQTAIDELVTSISYTDGHVSFTIPAGDHLWNIWINGRMEVEGFGGMSVHHLTDESESDSWESGKTYAFDVSDGAYAELYMDIQLDDEEATINLMDFFPENLQFASA